MEPHRHSSNHLSLASLLTIGLLFQACTPMPARETTAGSPPDHAGFAPTGSPDWPAGPDRRTSTSGEIYLANLDSQLGSLEQRISLRPNDRDLARLAELRYHRFQVLGNLADAEAARRLLDEARARPHDAAIDLASVQVLFGFHEFELAREILEHARAAGAAEESIARWRHAIASATGLVEQPREVPTLSADQTANQTADQASDPVALVQAAADELERGRPQAATALLKRAQESYVDSSPYVLAWIHVQQGIVFLRYGDHERARVFFDAAHQRFPQYALATEHLAETELALGNTTAALNLYRQVAAQTGHPEFLYRQSLTERDAGQASRAAKLAAQARQDYLDLVARYPLMYADHAAGYFLESGDVLRAYQLAVQNYRARQDISASALLIEVGFAAQRRATDVDALGTDTLTGSRTPDPRQLCAVLSQIRHSGYAPPELRDGDFDQKCATQFAIATIR